MLFPKGGHHWIRKFLSLHPHRQNESPGGGPEVTGIEIKVAGNEERVSDTLSPVDLPTLFPESFISGQKIRSHARRESERRSSSLSFFILSPPRILHLLACSPFRAVQKGRE